MTTGFISVFLCALRCNLSEPWIIFGTKCNALFDQWRAIVGLDIVTEIGLFSMVVYMGSANRGIEQVKSHLRLWPKTTVCLPPNPQRNQPHPNKTFH
jgi:hypothetical protein